MGDALLMYRCFVLLSNNIWIIILPAMLFITSSILAILTVVESVLPDASVFSGLSQSLGVPWVSLSVAFNVLVTSLICGRILLSYLALKRMGLAPNARERWGMIGILIESSLPFSIFGIVLAAFYGLPVTNQNSQVVSALADTWGGIVGISPQLIILRVAMGNAWTKNNVSSAAIQSTAMQFKNSTTRVMKESEISVVVNKECKREEDSTSDFVVSDAV
ncbi:hypothetical protein CPB84DRAFT_1879768 [Gymnopilus junonius]|uniref:Uncharacterized protein n=1 Tax=Gymnopilus junonius TaxID=109634 RepID=A0A9P5TI14_GYMJU|nr:hypothetical protein CPB84DRAFT_1879768 [Gymnopilus junonius]